MARRKRGGGEELIQTALALEAESAKEAGTLGYMARILTQCTMPHRRVDGTHFTRTNGELELNLVALDATVGLPYGTVPRLLLSWLTTEAVKTRQRTLSLGKSMSDFMAKDGLEMASTGGAQGTLPRFRQQAERLFGCAITARYRGEHAGATRNALIADSTDNWWDVKRPAQRGLWDMKVTLSRPFYESAVTRPIPVDRRVLMALRRSPLALDIAVWLPYRLSYLDRPTEIPWGALALQFGADYADVRQFKRRFRRHLRSVVTLLPAARVEDDGDSLVLRPSPEFRLK